MPFNLGWSEIMMVVILALVFLGPKKLPELASGLGKMIREIRKTTAGIKDEIQLEENIRKPLEELREAVTLPADELRRRDEWAKERLRWEKEEQERLAKEGTGEGAAAADQHEVRGDGAHDAHDSVLHEDDAHQEDSVDEGEHEPSPFVLATAPADGTQVDQKTNGDKTIAQPMAPATEPANVLADKTIAMKAPNFGTPRRPTPPPPRPNVPGRPIAPTGTVPQKPATPGSLRPPSALARMTPPPPATGAEQPATRVPSAVPPPPPPASRLPPPAGAARKIPAPDEEKV